MHISKARANYSQRGLLLHRFSPVLTWLDLAIYIKYSFVCTLQTNQFQSGYEKRESVWIHVLSISKVSFKFVQFNLFLLTWAPLVENYMYFVIRAGMQSSNVRYIFNFNWEKNSKPELEDQSFTSVLRPSLKKNLLQSTSFDLIKDRQLNLVLSYRYPCLTSFCFYPADLMCRKSWWLAGT